MAAYSHTRRMSGGVLSRTPASCPAHPRPLGAALLLPEMSVSFVSGSRHFSLRGNTNKEGLKQVYGLSAVQQVTQFGLNLSRTPPPPGTFVPPPLPKNPESKLTQRRDPRLGGDF